MTAIPLWWASSLLCFTASPDSKGRRTFSIATIATALSPTCPKRRGSARPSPTFGFTPCVGDYDNDGWPDIYVADDSTPSLLFMNNRDGTFRESGMLAGVAYDANGRTQGGMGADSVDYDGDGFLDLVKTNFSDEMPSLYHNEGKGFFTDVTVPSGLAGETTSVKWGTGFIDFDDDGQPDIADCQRFHLCSGNRHCTTNSRRRTAS